MEIAKIIDDKEKAKQIINCFKHYLSSTFITPNLSVNCQSSLFYQNFLGLTEKEQLIVFPECNRLRIALENKRDWLRRRAELLDIKINEVLTAKESERQTKTVIEVYKN